MRNEHGETRGRQYFSKEDGREVAGWRGIEDAEAVILAILLDMAGS